MGLKQWFCIVSRNVNEEVKTIMVCDDFVEACATQLATIVGSTPDMCKLILKEKELNEIKKNLETIGHDRIANDEEEVYIFFLPSRDKFR